MNNGDSPFGDGLGIILPPSQTLNLRAELRQGVGEKRCWSLF